MITTAAWLIVRHQIFFFLGDGMFKIWEAKDHKRPLRVGVGTDVGAGTNFSLPRQLNEAYKVSMLKKHSMGALKCFYMATKGRRTDIAS